jgi:alpha-mannosidase
MTWEGELYLELHNGTYTNMAEHKYYNRFMETLFRDIEIFYYIAEIAFSDKHKPEFSHQNIKDMWYVFLID